VNYKKCVLESFQRTLSFNKTMENKKFYNKSFSGRSLVAGILLIGGLWCGIYYLVFFTTSVEVPQQEIMGQVIGGEEINNIGLMQDRQNGIYLGFGAAVVGLALGYFGKRPKDKEE
jgi:hypothetical protein